MLSLIMNKGSPPMTNENEKDITKLASQSNTQSPSKILKPRVLAEGERIAEMV